MATEYNRELKCKDCKNAQGSFMVRLTRATYAMKCKIPEAWNEEKFDPVFGSIDPGYYSSCGVMRAQLQPCGPEAKKWVPRDTKLVFLALRNN
jgi:hypothetical protein